MTFSVTLTTILCTHDIAKKKDEAGMPVDCWQHKYNIEFAVTVMMSANGEPENKQFSTEKLHNSKKKF